MSYSLFELLVILPIHVVCIVSTSVFVRRVLPDSIASLALEPVDYSIDGRLWAVVGRPIRASKFEDSI